MTSISIDALKDNEKTDFKEIVEIDALENWLSISPEQSPPYNSICRIETSLGKGTGWIYSSPDGNIKLVITTAHILYNLKDQKVVTGCTVSCVDNVVFSATNKHFYIDWQFMMGKEYSQVAKNDLAVIIVPKSDRSKITGFNSFLNLTKESKNELRGSTLNIAGFPGGQKNKELMWFSAFSMPYSLNNRLIPTNLDSEPGLSGAPIWGFGKGDWQVVGISPCRIIANQKAQLLLLDDKVENQLNFLSALKPQELWLKTDKFGDNYPGDYIEAPNIDLRSVECPAGKKINGIRFTGDNAMLSINLYCTQPDGTDGEWVKPSGPENSVPRDSYGAFCITNLSVPEGKELAAVRIVADSNNGTIAPSVAYRDDQLVWVQPETITANYGNKYQDVHEVFPYSTGYTASGFGFWQNGNRIAPTIAFERSED